MGDQVALRPVSEDDLPVLEELTQDPEKRGEFGWFGWCDRQRGRRSWEENRLLSDDGGTLMVVKGEGRLGLVKGASACLQIAVLFLAASPSPG